MKSISDQMNWKKSQKCDDEIELKENVKSEHSSSVQKIWLAAISIILVCILLH